MKYILVSGNRKIWGFLFAYPDSVVVSIDVWLAKESGSIPDESNLNYGLDHPQMISGKATSTLYYLIFHATVVWEILTSQR